MDVVERFDLAPQHLGHVAALEGQAEELGQLADDDQDSDPADEADQHGAGEELRDEAEPERAGDHEHDPGQEGEGGEEHGVLLRRERGCDGGDRRGCSDRDGRARTDVELTARAEDGVEHARRERSREPRLGGSAGEGRIGDSLRDEHCPDREAGEKVGSEKRPLIARQPLGDRDVASEAFRHGGLEPHPSLRNMRWLGGSRARQARSRRPVAALSPSKESTVVAASYPFLDVLWSMVIFFAFIIWIWLLITVFADVFRRRDIGGGMKAIWIIFVILVPYLGVLIYLIAEHNGMADRSEAQMKQVKAQQDDYIKSVAGSSPADQIAQAKSLLDSGAISQAEFDALKAKALS